MPHIFNDYCLIHSIDISHIPHLMAITWYTVSMSIWLLLDTLSVLCLFPFSPCMGNVYIVVWPGPLRLLETIQRVTWIRPTGHFFIRIAYSKGHKKYYNTPGPNLSQTKFHFTGSSNDLSYSAVKERGVKRTSQNRGSQPKEWLKVVCFTTAVRSRTFSAAHPSHHDTPPPIRTKVMETDDFGLENLGPK